MATARELGPEGWKAYHGPQGPPPPELVEDPEAAALRIERAKQAAVRLKQMGASRVILFGSYAHRAWLTPTSDVDLAVLGLPPELFWEGWRVAEEIIGDRPVDFVALESASPALLREIEREGVEL